MRKFAIITGIVLLLAIVALLVAPQFIPADVYHEQVIRKVEATTGRDMEINGDISLRFLPRLQLTMHDVRLGNPPGFGAKAEPMMSLRELRLSLGFFDLLQGRVVIDSFNLIEPTIRLARNAKGEANWEFAPQETAPAQSSEQPPEKDAGFIGDVQLPNLEIQNGTLSYSASPSAEPLSLSQLNASLQLPSLSKPMTLTADTLWNGNLPMKLAATIDTPSDWLNNRETAYDIRISGDDNLAVFTAKGKASPPAEGGASTPVVQGEAHLAVESLKELGNKLGMSLLPETMKGEGKLSLRSMFSYADPQVKLLGASLTLDSLTVSGKADIRLNRTRPLITAELSTADVIMLDDFMPQDKPSVKAPQDETPATGINAEGWSDEPLMADTSAMKAVDADISLHIGGLKLNEMTFGAMEIAATLKNGTLNTQVPEFGFYGGTASAKATVQATGANTLAVSKNASIHNADIGQFLKDAYDFERLTGKGNLQLAFSMQGTSVRDFVNRLDGNGSFLLQNGAIRGFNLAQTVREARTLVKSVKNKDFTADMRSGAASDGVKTDFASLSGSFTITNGVLENRDLDLKAPLMTVTGAGTVNLPEKTVDYRLKPTLIGSLEGQKRTQNVSGSLSIPMRVTGTFDQLKFTPDASGLLQDALKDPKGTVENLEKNFKGLEKDVKSLFEGF